MFAPKSSQHCLSCMLKDMHLIVRYFYYDLIMVLCPSALVKPTNVVNFKGNVVKVHVFFYKQLKFWDEASGCLWKIRFKAQNMLRLCLIFFKKKYCVRILKSQPKSQYVLVTVFLIWRINNILPRKDFSYKKTNKRFSEFIFVIKKLLTKQKHHNIFLGFT